MNRYTFTIHNVMRLTPPAFSTIQAACECFDDLESIQINLNETLSQGRWQVLRAGTVISILRNPGDEAFSDDAELVASVHDARVTFHG